jgi:hypothetical protein
LWSGTATHRETLGAVIQSACPHIVLGQALGVRQARTRKLESCAACFCTFASSPLQAPCHARPASCPSRAGPERQSRPRSGQDRARYTVGTHESGRLGSATGTSGHDRYEGIQVSQPTQPLPGSARGGGPEFESPHPSCREASSLLPTRKLVTEAEPHRIIRVRSEPVRRC